MYRVLMSAKPDFYTTLGVDKGADDKALKSAYRKLAMKYHPDRNPDDAAAEAKFKEASEAYDILRDPQKRAAYDQYGHAAFEQGGGGRGQGGGFGGFDFNARDFNGMNVHDIFNEFFGDGGGRGGQGAGNRAQRGDDLRYNLTISLEEAYEGKQIDIVVPVAVTCEACDGSGADNPDDVETCGTCGGAGQVRVQQGFFAMAQACPACRGAGQTIKNKCRPCRGDGRVQEDKNLSVNLPAGIDDGMRVRLSGQGEAGLNGGPAGDVYIFVQLKDHPIFDRNGPDVHVQLPVDVMTAISGGTVDVPSPSGDLLELAIPAGTQSNQTFRLRAKGMPVPNQSVKGDILATVQVEIPSKLNRKQMTVVEEMTLEKRNFPKAEAFGKLLKRNGF